MTAPIVQFISRGIKNPASIPGLAFAAGDIAILFNQSEDHYAILQVPGDQTIWTVVNAAKGGDETYILAISAVLTEETAEAINNHYFTQDDQDAWFIDILKVSGSNGVIDTGGTSFGTVNYDGENTPMTMTVDTINPSGPDRLTLLFFSSEDFNQAVDEDPLVTGTWTDLSVESFDVGDTGAIVGVWSATFPIGPIAPVISWQPDASGGGAWFTLTLEPSDTTTPPVDTKDVYLDVDEVKAIFLGTKAVTAIYVGTTQIYP